MRDNAERRQNHDVNLGVAEEPENMLVHDRITTAGSIEERSAEVAVGQQHGDGASQHRHDRNQQVGRNQPGPAEHGHFHQRHAGGAHIQNSGNDVDRTHDGRGAQNVHRKNGHIHTDTHLRGQWRV